MNTTANYGQIALLGAGSWGTAMAIHLARNAIPVLLWGHHPQSIQQMEQDRQNKAYLPNLPFPDSLTPISDLSACVEQADHVIIAVPSHAFSKLLQRLPKPKHGLAWLTKGIDPSSHELLSELVAKRWGNTLPVAIISGPSFAREVAQDLPTALVLAGNDTKYLQTIRSLIHHHNMRAYTSDDLIGVQLCGAVKNVLAIACGISDGLEYGANAKAALITRGLAEMSRLGLELGARQETFLGLAGVGDLVLTCTDNQSRNRRFGLQLGQGTTLSDAEKKIGQVVEGKYNAAQVCTLAKRHRVEMPICTVVNDLLHNRLTPEQAVKQLMQRPARHE